MLRTLQQRDSVPDGSTAAKAQKAASNHLSQEDPLEKSFRVVSLSATKLAVIAAEPEARSVKPPEGPCPVPCLFVCSRIKIRTRLKLVARLTVPTPKRESTNPLWRNAAHRTGRCYAGNG